jgi:sterol desaturase/sphingolipid hydroxylase (fatty acid hydroxylase superfamily)
MEFIAWFFGKTYEYFERPVANWDAFVHSITYGLRMITALDSKTGWLFLITSAMVAHLIYLWEKKRGVVSRATSFVGFLLPRSVYRHRSAFADYRYVAIDLTLKSITYLPIISGVGYLAYKITLMTRDALFPSLPGYITAPFSPFVTTLIIVLIADFGVYFGHWLAHKVKFFWIFHAVHHSAEVLTPVTAYRGHPVDELLAAVASGAIGGLFATAYTEFTGNNLELTTILGINVFNFFFFVAHQLRHSHIWLSYGPILSRVFVSPAQHQIHHSQEERHWDKNFGFIFAFWDQIFGTIYVPKGRETFKLGVHGGDPEDYATVGKLYWLPFVKAARYLRDESWMGRLAGLSKKPALADKPAIPAGGGTQSPTLSS